jgi:hypothetical protein
MALLDNFSNPFEGMNIFGARLPTYLSGIPASEGVDATKGLLAQTEIDKLKNQALFQGLLGTAATYLSQPKNQNYGSALPYLAKAYLGGMQGSQGVYDQATQNLLTKGKLAESQREAETAAIIKDTQTTLMADKKVQDSPVLKALVAKGQFKDVADIISPKPAENDYDRYSFAYKEKPFKDLTAPEKQEIIKKVQSDKKDQATQINLGSPVAGVDAQGQPVFFQPSKAGGQAVIVPGIKPLQEPKAPTESQAKAATFYSQMTSASKELEDLQKEGFKTNDPYAQFGVNIAGTPLRAFTSPQAQRARQIQEQWTESFLRIKTGAAATRDEIKSNTATFFPQIGETDPSIIEQKSRARLQAEQDVLAMTKPSTQPIQSTQPKTQTNTQATPQTNRAYLNNRPIVVKGNKWVFEDTGEEAK